MKLAEALAERADFQRRMAQLKQRVQQNAQYQEGETPAEQPLDLLEEYGRCADAWEKLVTAINRSNHKIFLENGENMTAALARRDRLKAEHGVLTALADAPRPNNRVTAAAKSKCWRRWT
nr:DIP1984 family protein [Conchiformibius kuhniae]